MRRAFAENNVAMELLPHLTSDDLKELGVKSVGNRRKLLVAIAALSLKRGELQSQASPQGTYRRYLPCRG
jgi:hypothetical protein